MEESKEKMNTKSALDGIRKSNSFPSPFLMDKNIENDLAVVLSQLRTLGKKKQAIFLSAAKGLISGISKNS